jgi:hypothetical protein
MLGVFYFNLNLAIKAGGILLNFAPFSLDISQKISFCANRIMTDPESSKQMWLRWRVRQLFVSFCWLGGKCHDFVGNMTTSTYSPLCGKLRLNTS